VDYVGLNLQFLKVNLRKFTVKLARLKLINIIKMEAMEMKGTVKFFNDMKGFGFITPEEGDDVFVHQTDLKEGTTLHENDSVKFDVEQGERGPKAVNVELASSEEETKEESSEEETKEESSE
jgi:cold shock protein